MMQTYGCRGIVVAILFLGAIPSTAQIAKGANKYLGNTTTNGAIRSDFGRYWNQITPEVESRWTSIEQRRGTYDWSSLDKVVTYAMMNGIPWKISSLINGGSTQSWLMSLPPSAQRDAIEAWFDTLAFRYPNAPMIEVVSEGHPNHMPAAFRNALGGTGATGFDWILEAFRMAAARWPKAVLIYNDYGNIENSAEMAWTESLIHAARNARVRIDALGCEGHEAYNLQPAVLKKNLDRMARLEMPLHISEYDVPKTNDSVHASIVSSQFPVFWNHPCVAGVTFWGHLVGSTWSEGAGWVRPDGKERPALVWLKEYVRSNPGASYACNTVDVEARARRSGTLGRGRLDVDLHRGTILWEDEGRKLDVLGRPGAGR